jgi:hypothetical protein
MRDADGDLPASAEHVTASRAARRRLSTTPDCAAGDVFQRAYDDGNGLWYVNPETPSDLGFCDSRD